LEHRFEPFSQGRGFITPERVDEMETIAARHGIYLAPLYNADGPVEDALMVERMSASAKGQVELPHLLFEIGWEAPGKFGN